MIKVRGHAVKIQMLMDMYQTNIPTGKRGRPKKLITKKDLKKILKEMGV